MSNTPCIPTQETPEDKANLLRVACYGGKYTVILPAAGGLHALRHGEKWRDCLGDGLILALAQDLQDAREAIEKLLNDYDTEDCPHPECSACKASKAAERMARDVLAQARK